MKKHNLFKVLSILLVLVLITSYFIASRDGTMSYIAIGDLIINEIQSLYYFFDIALFTLVVGGFYGVLNKTGAYKKLLDKVSNKFKGEPQKFIYGVIIIFALLTALTGITYPLIIFVPMVISIILLLGYDKLVALSATIGAILVGFIGGIFITFRDSSAYSLYLTTFEEFLDLEKFSNIFPKIFILLAGIILLILYINRHIKNAVKENKRLNIKDDSDVLVSEVKGSYKTIKLWPLITILSLTLVIFVLGLVPWSSLFSLTIFDNFHTWLTSLQIGEFIVITNIISKNLVAFGTWISLGNYLLIIVTIIVMIIILKFIYKIKLDDLIDSFIEGMSKMLPAAILIVIANAVLVTVYNHGMMETIVTNVTKFTNGFNLTTTTLISSLGSMLCVDFFYTVQGVFQPIITALGETTTASPVLDILFQSIYGLVMLIAPTSIVLITGLSYLKIPYSTWVKYIWKLVVELFVLIFVVLLLINIM